MDRKTKINAEVGRQELMINREFELPLELLFKAYVESEIVEQWMGTKVLKLECKKHSSYQFETTDSKGNKHGVNGVIHEFIPNKKITRTFEMENTPFIALGNSVNEIFPPLLLVILTVVSWYFRPAERKIIPIAIPTAN